MEVLGDILGGSYHSSDWIYSGVYVWAGLDVVGPIWSDSENITSSTLAALPHSSIIIVAPLIVGVYQKEKESGNYPLVWKSQPSPEVDLYLDYLQAVYDAAVASYRAFFDDEIGPLGTAVAKARVCVLRRQRRLARHLLLGVSVQTAAPCCTPFIPLANGCGVRLEGGGIAGATLLYPCLYEGVASIR